MSENTVKKKKRIPKNRKLYWRKHTDLKDVEDFLDEKRQEERLGGPFTSKKNEELFTIDTSPNEITNLNTSKLNKKQRALLPPRCFELLKPLTSVPDPFIKRNRVRTKEERKSSIRKAIEEKKRQSGFVPNKVLEASYSRSLTLRKKKQKPKEHVFKKDIWDVKDSGDKENFESTEWLNEETVRHNLTNLGAFKVRTPAGLTKRKSVVPTIETPHPGTSYNPSLKDHKELIDTVVDKELEKLKEEAHIKRVTSDLFNKVTQAEKANTWIEEMSQGLTVPEGKGENSEEETETGGEYKAINPPVTFGKKKTKKQRRKQKEEKEAALQRKKAKIEKRKVADLYKLRFIDKDIKTTESKQQQHSEKRKKLAALNVARTKRLGGRTYEEQDLSFARAHELSGNLRTIKSIGSILTDRFYSMQKRNMIVPSVKRLGVKKKVKRFFKASHKIENIEKM